MGKSIATRMRQAAHSKKQAMYYMLGIKKRGYSPQFLKDLEKAREDAKKS